MTKGTPITLDNFDRNAAPMIEIPAELSRDLNSLEEFASLALDTAKARGITDPIIGWQYPDHLLPLIDRQIAEGANGDGRFRRALHAVAGVGIVGAGVARSRPETEPLQDSKLTPTRRGFVGLLAAGAVALSGLALFGRAEQASAAYCGDCNIFDSYVYQYGRVNCTVLGAAPWCSCCRKRAQIYYRSQSTQGCVHCATYTNQYESYSCC